MAVESVPSRPFCPHPQHLILPVVPPWEKRAQIWWPPADTFVATSVLENDMKEREVMSAGARPLLRVLPVPNWPYCPDPQQIILPTGLEKRAHV